MKSKFVLGSVLFLFFIGSIGFAQNPQTPLSVKVIKLINSGEVKIISIYSNVTFVSERNNFQITEGYILKFEDESSEEYVDISQVYSFNFRKKTGALVIRING